MTLQAPVFFGEPLYSTFGVMAFPDDLGKAEAATGIWLSQGPLPALLEEDGTLSDQLQRALCSGLGNNLASADEIADRLYWGTAVGVATRTLLALTRHHPGLAGWEKAIQITRCTPGLDAPISRSAFRGRMSQFQSVLHLWGALALRGGFEHIDDADDFLAEAEALLADLRKWLATRHENVQRQESYLSSEKLEPWSGWSPPAEARLWIPPALTDSQLEPLRKAGRPPK